MNKIEELQEEIEVLKAKQELHRRQLEENRRKALDKKKQAKQYIMLGKLVESMLPDAKKMTEEEVCHWVKEKFSSF